MSTSKAAPVSPPVARLDDISEPPLDSITIYDTPTQCYLLATDHFMEEYRLILFLKRSAATLYEQLQQRQSNATNTTGSCSDDVEDSYWTHLHDDMRYAAYSRTEADSLIEALERQQSMSATSSAMRRLEAVAVLGCVRFALGYYLVVVTERRLAGYIGAHRIFEATQVHLVSLLMATSEDSETVATEPRRGNEKGVAARRHMDRHYAAKLLSTLSRPGTFFYSHTYDLTNTLQANMMTTAAGADEPVDPTRAAGPVPHPRRRRMQYVWNEYLMEPWQLPQPSPQDAAESPVNSPEAFTAPHREDVEPRYPPSLSRWVVYLIHGSVIQRPIKVPQRRNAMLMLTLIARVSKESAGVRYLRRGINSDGNVANHVEVEQIASDESAWRDLYREGCLSSYVQLRGSVPLRWYHPPSATRLLPKPSIVMGPQDPQCSATCLHFKKLLAQYSGPIVVHDLLRQSERHEREGALSNAYRDAVQVLTSAVDRAADGAAVLQYDATDLKQLGQQAWNSMTAAAERHLKAVGFFVCRCLDESRVPMDASPGDGQTGVTQIQQGVVRSNCLDCIDRTNLGQFFHGLQALGAQLEALGLLASSADLTDSPAISALLLDMYLIIGDALATQYGGSALVGAGVLHRGAGWDQFMGVKRLYHNMMSDSDKQDAIHLLLGRVQPVPRRNSPACNSEMHRPHRTRVAGVHVASVDGLNSSMTASLNLSMSSDGGAPVDSDLTAPTKTSFLSELRRFASAAWRGESRADDDAAGNAVASWVFNFPPGEAEVDYYDQTSTAPRLPPRNFLTSWWVAPLLQYRRDFTWPTCHSRTPSASKGWKTMDMAKADPADHSSLSAEERSSSVPSAVAHTEEVATLDDAIAQRLLAADAEAKAERRWRVATAERRQCVSSLCGTTNPSSPPTAPADAGTASKAPETRPGDDARRVEPADDGLRGVPRPLYLCTASAVSLNATVSHFSSHAKVPQCPSGASEVSFASNTTGLNEGYDIGGLMSSHQSAAAIFLQIFLKPPAGAVAAGLLDASRWERIPASRETLCYPTQLPSIIRSSVHAAAAATRQQSSWKIAAMIQRRADYEADPGACSTADAAAQLGQLLLVEFGPPSQWIISNVVEALQHLLAPEVISPAVLQLVKASDPQHVAAIVETMSSSSGRTSSTEHLAHPSSRLHRSPSPTLGYGSSTIELAALDLLYQLGQTLYQGQQLMGGTGVLHCTKYDLRNSSLLTPSSPPQPLCSRDAENSPLRWFVDAHPRLADENTVLSGGSSSGVAHDIHQWLCALSHDPLSPLELREMLQNLFNSAAPEDGELPEHDRVRYSFNVARRHQLGRSVLSSDSPNSNSALLFSPPSDSQGASTSGRSPTPTQSLHGPTALVVRHSFTPTELHAWLLHFLQKRLHGRELQHASLIAWHLAWWAVEVGYVLPVVPSSTSVLAMLSDDTSLFCRSATLPRFALNVEFSSIGTLNRYPPCSQAGLWVMGVAPSMGIPAAPLEPVDPYIVGESLAGLGLRAATQLQAFLKSQVPFNSGSSSSTPSQMPWSTSLASPPAQSILARWHQLREDFGPHFAVLLHSLQRIQLDTLVGGAAGEPLHHSLAFFINIFNAVYVHAWLLNIDELLSPSPFAEEAEGPGYTPLPPRRWQRRGVEMLPLPTLCNTTATAFYEVYGVYIGTQFLSLADIKYGVLGGNRAPPYRCLPLWAPVSYATQGLSRVAALHRLIPPHLDAAVSVMERLRRLRDHPQVRAAAHLASVEARFFSGPTPSSLTTPVDCSNGGRTQDMPPPPPPPPACRSLLLEQWISDVVRYLPHRILLGLLDTYLPPPFFRPHCCTTPDGLRYAPPFWTVRPTSMAAPLNDYMEEDPVLLDVRDGVRYGVTTSGQSPFVKGALRRLPDGGSAGTSAHPSPDRMFSASSHLLYGSNGTAASSLELLMSLAVSYSTEFYHGDSHLCVPLRAEEVLLQLSTIEHHLYGLIEQSSLITARHLGTVSQAMLRSAFSVPLQEAMRPLLSELRDSLQGDVSPPSVTGNCSPSASPSHVAAKDALCELVRLLHRSRVSALELDKKRKELREVQ